MRTFLSLLLLLLLSLAVLSLATTRSLVEDTKGTPNKEECAYTLFVQTGTVDDADTRSVISLTLAGSEKGKEQVQINNLVSWGGVMGSGHSYFQKGNLDVFRGTGRCLPTPPCWMLLSSDGTGAGPGWYVDYVDVTTVGPNMSTCAIQRFDVNTWLYAGDPYHLYAIVDDCPVARAEAQAYI